MRPHHRKNLIAFASLLPKSAATVTTSSFLTVFVSKFYSISRNSCISNALLEPPEVTAKAVVAVVADKAW